MKSNTQALKQTQLFIGKNQQILIKKKQPHISQKDISYLEIDLQIQEKIYKTGYSIFLYQFLDSLQNFQIRQKVIQDYVQNNSNFQERYRFLLVDWVFDVISNIQVSYKLKISKDATYLSINLIDQYLSLKNIPKNKLQLLGISCLFIASKLQVHYKKKDVTPPNSCNLCSIANNLYSQYELFAFEFDIYQTLNFEVWFVNFFAYKNLFQIMFKYFHKISISSKEIMLINIFSEILILEYQVQFMGQIEVAVALLILVNKMVSQNENIPLLNLNDFILRTGKSLSVLKEAISVISLIIKKSSFQKYGQSIIERSKINLNTNIEHYL